LGSQHYSGNFLLLVTLFVSFSFTFRQMKNKLSGLEFVKKKLSLIQPDKKEDGLGDKVSMNFRKVNSRYFIPPFLILILCYLYFLLFKNGGDPINEYVNIQKDLFLRLNFILSRFPQLQLNLTQLGDVLISFTFVSIFIVYAPKIWKVLLTSSIISLIVTALLKKLFAVPRPAAMLDADSFVIIGRTLTGNNSLPSGHSISTFIVITVLLIAFMPKSKSRRITWSLLMISAGLIIALSRVGVGAHYPLDVVTGSAIGYILAVAGVLINLKTNWFSFIKAKKLRPVLLLLVAVWMFFVARRIVESNLLIFYFSLLFLAITLFIMSKSYVQKRS